MENLIDYYMDIYCLGFFEKVNDNLYRDIDIDFNGGIIEYTKLEMLKWLNETSTARYKIYKLPIDKEVSEYTKEYMKFLENS